MCARDEFESQSQYCTIFQGPNIENGPDYARGEGQLESSSSEEEDSSDEEGESKGAAVDEDDAGLTIDTFFLFGF